MAGTLLIAHYLPTRHRGGEVVRFCVVRHRVCRCSGCAGFVGAPRYYGGVGQARGQAHESREGECHAQQGS